MTEPLLQATPPPTCRDPQRRIRRLIAALAASCTVPLLSWLVPNEVAWMPLEGAFHTPPIGVMLALSFWVGLGGAPLVMRLVSGVVGVVYLTAASVAVEWMRYSLIGEYEYSLQDELIAQAAMVGIAVALFSGVFMALRRRWALLPAREPDGLVAPRSQFSVLYILLLTAGAALVFTLIRASRDTLRASDGSMIAANMLGFVVFAANAVCAAFAALRPTPTGRSCALVLLIACVLGIALSLGANHDLVDWWSLAVGPVISVLPTAILLGSLLVVRSTGYRLLRKSEMTSSSHEQPLDESGALPLHSPDAAERMSR